MKNNIGFESKLNHEFEESFQLLAEALKSEGFGILTQIDVRKTFKEKINEDFRRYAILGVCNPPLAHKVLSHNAEAGLLLPCTITIEFPWLTKYYPTMLKLVCFYPVPSPLNPMRKGLLLSAFSIP